MYPYPTAIELNGCTAKLLGGYKVNSSASESIFINPTNTSFTYTKGAASVNTITDYVLFDIGILKLYEGLNNLTLTVTGRYYGSSTDYYGTLLCKIPQGPFTISRQSELYYDGFVFYQYLYLDNPLYMSKTDVNANSFYSLTTTAPNYWINSTPMTLRPTNWVKYTFSSTSFLSIATVGATLTGSVFNTFKTLIDIKSPYLGDYVRTTQVKDYYYYPVPYSRPVDTLSWSVILNIANLNSVVGTGTFNQSNSVLIPLWGNQTTGFYNAFSRSSIVNVTNINPFNLYIADSSVDLLATLYERTKLLIANTPVGSATQDAISNNFIVSSSVYIDALVDRIFYAFQNPSPMKIRMDYPFGIVYNATKYQVKFDYLYSSFRGQFTMASLNQYFSYQGYYYYFQTFFPLWSPTMPVVPTATYGQYVVSGISFKKISSFTFVVRINTASPHGFRILNIYEQNIRDYDLISGDLTNGQLEIVIDFLPTQLATFYKTYSYIHFYDFQGIFDYDSDTFSISPFSNPVDFIVPTVPPGLTPLEVDDITYWKFEPNNIDVSDGPVRTTLIFNFTNGTPDDIPSIYVPPRSQSPDSINPNYIYRGYFNETTKLFNIPIYIKEKTFTGTLKYNLTGYPAQIPYEIIKINFGYDADLNVTSRVGDEMGPIVTKIVKASGSTVRIQPNTNGTISWNITINDSSGFKYGVAMIVSDYDIGPTNITFSGSDVKSGDKYNGVYQISKEINGNCRSQTYTLHLELFDYLDNMASSKYYFYSSAITPVYFMFNTSDAMYMTTINVVCYVPVDDTPPTLSNFTLLTPSVDVGQINREISAIFTISDMESGIALEPKNNPYLYATSHFGLHHKMASTLVSSDGQNATYQVNGQLPYGFGMKGIILSIYGAFNNHLSINGFPTSYLKTNGFSYYVSTTFNIKTPILESANNVSMDGGLAFVRGRKMGLDTDIVTLTVYYENETLVVAPTAHSSTIFTVQIRAGNDSVTVKLNVNGIDSNLLTINRFVIPVAIPVPPIPPTPTPTDPTPSPTNPTSSPSNTPNPVVCPGKTPCSDHGKCIDGECVCSNPWNGPDCSSRNHILPPPPIQPSQPTINNTIPSGNDDFNKLISTISIVSLRELSSTGDVLVTHTLSNWTMYNLTTEKNFIFRYELVLEESNVTVDIEYFFNETTIVFANENITMLPSTIKYSVSLTPYRFKDNLSTLQLVMSAALSSNDDDTCSKVSYGGTKDNLQWIKLNIDEQSLYGRFLRVAEIDDAAVSITNSLLDEEMNPVNTESSVQTFIGINIPHFTRNVKLDPDFSALIDQGDLTNGKCKRSSKLSTAAIAGITVGAVVFVAAAVGTTMYFVKKAKFNANIKKMEKRMSQLKTNSE
ncbi:EGF-like domain-containing protein [Heterostelium album PN500]|uniref:EGF-like domain-containing protein n=1 Tax=Heterostelium pallidum (strain ATCC 26659 / Pp 5 / PN500) TaxID=670386 RepID=D3B949_HETP5|nr:EGF-like domain-containing protein [Heterostelium album PN500]EFA82088.1 EGF-like domain-containing protein [Heterostelium album PN500]|eukprot:XP_020434205.1 EGF-like domain-containing protein [Heterostelium album PN500]